MGKTERWVDQQIKERNRRLVRKHWWRLGLVGLAIAGLGAATWAVVPALQVPLWGVVPALCVFFLAGYWDQFAGTGNLANGRDAEGWTSKELRRVCGRDWHVLDGLQFKGYDVDHVLVGPGGVYVVETKYTESVVDLASHRGRRRADDWIYQARRGERAVASVLGNSQLRLHPMVVVWGSEVSNSPYKKGTVPVLRPNDLQDATMPWRRGAAGLSGDQIDTIVHLLRDHQVVNF